MTTYIADLGDSNDGPIGCYVEVRADNKEIALRHVKSALNHVIQPIVVDTTDGQIRVYFNHGAVKSTDIYAL
jgi:hypothetical protein